MALTPKQIKEAQKEQEKLNSLIKEYNDLSGESMKNPLDPKNFSDAAKFTKAVNDEMRKFRSLLLNAQSGLDGIISRFKDIGKEIKSGYGDPLKNSTKSVGRLFSLTERLADAQFDLSTANLSQIKSDKKKAQLELARIARNEKELETKLDSLKQDYEAEDITERQREAIGKKIAQTEELLDIARDENREQEEKIGYLEDINKAYDETIKRVDNINKASGLTGKILGGMGGFLEKIGFKGMGDEVQKINQNLKQQAVELTNNGEKAAGVEGAFTLFKSGIRQVGAALADSLKDPLVLTGLLAAAIGKIVKLFTHLDEAVGKTGRALGLTRSSAQAMVGDMKSLASASNDTFLNMDRMLDAQLRISKITGTNVRLTGEQLGNQARLAEFVGLTDEELRNVYRSSLLTGKSQSELYDSVVATNDSIFSTVELFREAANVTGELALKNGNNVAQISRSVAAAKRLGINMETARDMAMGTLDFESSIRAEMEAAVLTGESINLNRARELAFQRRYNEAAAEMLRQKAVQKAFEEGNIIALTKAAEAVGLTVDQLSDIRNQQMENAAIQRRQREIMEEMSGKRYEQLTAEEKIALKGEAQLKALRENQTVSERIADASAKIGDFFGSMILPAVEAVADSIESFSKFLGYTSTDTEKIAKSSKDMKDEFATVDTTVKDIDSKVSTFQATMQSVFGKIKDYPVLSTLAAVAGGALVFKGLGKLKDTVLGKMGLGKLGTAGNPMHVTMSGGGGIMDFLNPSKKKPGNILKHLKKPGQLLKNLGPKLLKGSGVLSLVGAGVDLVGNLNAAAQTEDKGIGDALVRTLDENKFMALGAAIGSVVPVVGTLVGAGIGGILDFANKSILGEKGMLTDAINEPEMATGGIVTRPTRALIGEAGAEAVIPLNEFYAKMDELINVVKSGGDIVMDGRKVGTTLQMASYKL